MPIGKLTRAGGVAVVGTTVALAAGGCGTAADGRQARTATERLYAAAQRHDGQTACAQLSPALRQQLVADESEPTCARAVLQARPARHAGPRGCGCTRTSAQVTLDGGDTVFLGDTKHDLAPAARFQRAHHATATQG